MSATQIVARSAARPVTIAAGISVDAHDAVTASGVSLALPAAEGIPAARFLYWDQCFGTYVTSDLVREDAGFVLIQSCGASRC